MKVIWPNRCMMLDYARYLGPLRSLRHKTTVSCVVHGLTWSFCGYKAPCRFAWGAFAEDSTASAEALWCGATGGWLQLPKRTRPWPQSPCWSWSVTVEHSWTVKWYKSLLRCESLWLTTVIITRQFLCSYAACENPDKLPPQIRSLAQIRRTSLGNVLVVHVNAGAKRNLSCKSDPGHWQVFRAFISCNLFRFWFWANSRSNELT